MAADPWARFDSVLAKTRPKASPWDRFDAALSTAAPPGVPGPWEATASPLVQRRRMPDGTYETRPAPRPDAGPAEPPSAIDPTQHPHAAFGQQVLTRAAEGVASLADLASIPVDALARAARYAAPPSNPGQALARAATPRAQEAPLSGVLYGDRADERQGLHQAYELERERVAERLRNTPVLAATADLGLDLGSDLTNLLPGGAGKVALREVGEEALQRTARQVAAVAPHPPVDEFAYTAEELAGLAARKRGLARLRPEDIERTLPLEPPPVRLGQGIPDAEVEQRLGMRASPEDAEELRRLSLEIGEGSEPDSSPWSRFDDELARAAPEPSPVLRPKAYAEMSPEERKAGLFGKLSPSPSPLTSAPGGRTVPPPQFDEPPEIAVVRVPRSEVEGDLKVDREGARDSRHGSWFLDQKDVENLPPLAPLRMSTKGVENVAGMQDDLRRVVEANRPEIEAARGPVVPVSQWHDAPALAAKLGLAPDDYLAMPAGRTLNPDEGALGKHYLGNMKQQALEIEGRIARGEVDDMAAAVAEKNARNREVVRMMAVLQGQGSSEAGRYMRMLQEALDPYGLAETPRDKLRLGLLKRYKEANATEAARLEAAAVARLKRQAARETRKAARQATAAELSDELGQLAAQFGSLSRRPRGMAGGIVPLDPELVEVVGRMAANRVRAGVVAVEELADQVYTAVSRQVDGVSREQVKAAIVEHALGSSGRTMPKLSPEEARLRTAEAATARSIAKLEERVVAGGLESDLKATSSAWSAKLGELKARQAELRKRLAGVQAGQRASTAPPGNSAASKLRAREQALARQVEKAEERLAAGPQVPQAKASPLDSPRLGELRQRLNEVRAQLAADPKEGLAARYRELLDDQTIEMIATLPDPVEDPDALLDFLRLMERPTWKDYAGAYVYNNLLSGPKSLLRNVVGNTVKRWDRIVMQPLSAGFERVLAPMQGRLPERYVQEVLPMVVGSYQGAPEALQKGLWVLKNGWDPERVVGELTGVKGSAKYYEGRLPVDPFLLSQNKAVRALGAVHGYGPRLMQVGDVMARTRNFSSATHAWATRTAINDVKRGTATDVAARAAELLREQPEEMIEYAQRVAREDTFQDEVSNVAKLIGAGRREDTGVGFLLNQTVRFLNVPDRIMAWLGDYTPGLRVAGAAWKGGKLRQAWGTPEASDILARQAFGTALAGAAAAWAFQGKLAGNAPRDEKLRNDFYATGKQPNSVLVGGRWVPIRDVFGGWAGPVVAAAAFHDSAMTGEPVDGEELLRRAGGAALGEARFLLDAGYLSTLSDTVGAIQAEPDQAGAAMSGLATRTAAGALVPWSGLQRNIAITQDPRVVDKEGPLDEVKAGIPGLRQTLPARIGTLGEELQQSTGAAGGFLPVVPTRNRVADPGGAEDVERLRATLAAKRREVGRVEADIKTAIKAKNSARIQELRQSLPFSINPETGKPSRVTTARLDKIMESIRADEMRIRKLRASGKPEDVIRRAEVEIQRKMAARLEKALTGLR